MIVKCIYLLLCKNCRFKKTIIKELTSFKKVMFNDDAEIRVDIRV